MDFKNISVFKKIAWLIPICFLGLSRLAWSQTTTETRAPLLFEKTYLHTDRDVYAPGDTLWFKAYLVNAQNHQPTGSSRNLYVEFIAPDSAKILTREIIRMDNGLGNGDISLSDSLPTGKYHLRAYTNWMRNFGDNFIFEKEITIIHANAVTITPKVVPITKNKPNGKNAATISPAVTSTVAPIVRFYPEGGSLVEGLGSLVAVKAEDGSGKGIAVSGMVLSSSGDTVSRFTCDSLGMSLLTLLPVNGQAYHAVVNLPHGLLNWPAGGQHDKLIVNLPAALSRGLTLHVKQTDSLIHAVINSYGTLLPDMVTIVVKHGGKTEVKQPLQLANQQTSVKILTANLPEGISAITLYNSEGKPECERLVYIHHPGNGKNAVIVTGKSTYRPKQRITMQVSAPANSSLSMAVVDADIAPGTPDDILSYLQLQSEIKGNIENARRYFDTTNVNRFKQLDLLLMTQGWRDFMWRRLADTAIRISYEAENGIFVPGRIRDENHNKLLPGLNISLYASDAKGNKLFMAKSDSLGRFGFRGLMLYGMQSVKLSAVNEKGEKKGAFWIDTLLPMPVKARDSRTVAQDSPIDSVVAVIMKKRIADEEKRTGKITQLKEVQINDKYKPTVLSDGTTYSPWGTSLNQSFTITPKDYELKDLQWYALYHLNGAIPKLYDYGIEIAGGGKPLLIINGKMKDRYDLTNYYSIPIDRFKSIRFKRVYLTAVGPKKIMGFIAYLLFLDLKDNYATDNPGATTAVIAGYYQARTFYQPVPGTKPSPADYRSTIHWEPNIKTDTTGKATVSFYNTLPNTNVRIIVEGISPTGVPLVSQAAYRTE